MIYLTKRTGEKIRFLLNHRIIEQIAESNNGTLITTREGNLFIVEETLEEIKKEVQKFEAEILLLSQKKKEEGPCS